MSAHHAGARTLSVIDRVSVPQIEDEGVTPIDGDREDEAMNANDQGSHQRAWRIAWAGERQDDSWTRSFSEEVAIKAAALAGGVRVDHLSCRETVCRAYLKFEDQLDAAEFITMPHDPGHQYEFQGLDPAFDGAGFDRSDYTFELLIARPRPAHLPEHPPIIMAEGVAR